MAVRTNRHGFLGLGGGMMMMMAAAAAAMSSFGSAGISREPDPVPRKAHRPLPARRYGHGATNARGRPRWGRKLNGCI